jgi:heat shock protein HslJ
MKKKLFLLLFAVWIWGGGSTLKASAIREEVTITAITGREWKLIAVRIDNSDAGFNRDPLVREWLGRFFTAVFDAGLVRGTGAPNRYSAPYALGDNQSIKIMVMLSTKMAPLTDSLFQMENLTEDEFFTYMQNAFEWRLVNNNLELQSKTAGGNEVTLVFAP